MGKAVLAMAMIVVLGGCGWIPTEAGLRAQLDEEKGKHIDQVVKESGRSPDAVHAFEDGRKQYTWVRRTTMNTGDIMTFQPKTATVYSPTSGMATVNYTEQKVIPGTDIHGVCNMNLIADQNGYVIDYTYSGNDCIGIHP